jgi:hypothetical protein
MADIDLMTLGRRKWVLCFLPSMKKTTTPHHTHTGDRLKQRK